MYSEMITIGLTCAIAVATVGTGDEPMSILLWPDGVPDSPIVHDDEEETINRDIDQNKQGLNRSIERVSIPSMTIHPAPEDKATGAAVVICPGGGYRRVVVDKEGYDAAKLLNDAGIMAFVLKYRTWPSGIPRDDMEKNKAVMGAIISDGKRAMRIVRSRAAEWNIDPEKIGIMGFSAGGNLSASVATQYDQGQTNAEDPIEQVSCRPNFVGLIYPAMPRDIESLINTDTPPMFIVCADDDQTTPAKNCIQLYQALHEAEISVAMHIYTKGGHGFGIGVKGGSVISWPDLYVDWLRDLEFLP